MSVVTHIDREIDARAMPCPASLMSLIDAIHEGGTGDVTEVLASDAASATDIPAWVGKAGHELVDVVQDDGFRRFIVRSTR